MLLATRGRCSTYNAMPGAGSEGQSRTQRETASKEAAKGPDPEYNAEMEEDREPYFVFPESVQHV